MIHGSRYDAMKLRRRKARNLTELDRIVSLAQAAPLVRYWREAGRTWDEIVLLATANPLGLSKRQLARIYEGPGAYEWDNIRRAARSLDKLPHPSKG